MKKLTSIMLVLILAFGALAVSVSAATIAYSNDMEAVSASQNFKANQDPCAEICYFGQGAATQGVSTAQAHSGKQSVSLGGRAKLNGSFKFNNIFTLTKEDVGKTLKVSIWAYLDKAAGVYKDETPTAFTAEELAKSTGSYLTIHLAGPDGQDYKHRSGTTSLYPEGEDGKRFIKWNEWTEISVTFTVTEDMLDNGAHAGDKTNPMIAGIRVNQGDSAAAPYGVDAGLIGAFYLDDLKVEEVVVTPAPETTESPKTETPAAPATFDAAVVIAVVAAVAGAGVVVSKKKH